MPLLSFLLRRLLIGGAARFVTGQLTKRFNMTPGVANIIFLVVTELLAQQSERLWPASPGGSGAKPSRGK